MKNIGLGLLVIAALVVIAGQRVSRPTSDSTLPVLSWRVENLGGTTNGKLVITITP